VTQLFSPLADTIAGPDRELRAELCASRLLGVALMRYVLRAEPRRLRLDRRAGHPGSGRRSTATSRRPPDDRAGFCRASAQYDRARTSLEYGNRPNGPLEIRTRLPPIRP